MPLFEKADTLNEDLIALTMVACGTFICFWGGKFFKHVVFFVGFIIGGLMAYYAVQAMFELFGAALNAKTLLYISLTVGTLTGVLCVVIYKAAVFTVGAVAGLLFAQMVYQFVLTNFDISKKNIIQPCMLVGFMFLGGLLAFKFVEFVLKGITAFVGAFFFAAGGAYLAERFGNNDKEGNAMDWVQFFSSSSKVTNLNKTCNVFCWVCLFLWFTLTIAGATYQYKIHKKHDPKDYDDDVSDSEYSSSGSYYTDSEDSSEERRKEKERKRKEKLRKKKLQEKKKKQKKNNKKSKKQQKTRKRGNSYRDDSYSDDVSYVSASASI